MAQLQRPPTLLGELPHSWEVVDDHGLNAPRVLRRDGGQGLLPARSALLPRKQQGIEEGGVVAAAGLERPQVQDLRRSVELDHRPSARSTSGPRGIFCGLGRATNRRSAWRKRHRYAGNATPRRLENSWPSGDRASSGESSTCVRIARTADAVGQTVEPGHHNKGISHAWGPCMRITPNPMLRSEGKPAFRTLRINRISLPIPKFRP